LIARPDDYARLAVHLEGVCGESRFESTLPVRFKTGTTTFAVAFPRLWWPAGYGGQPLYNVRISLLEDGAEIDAKEFKFGIRNVELSRTQTAGKDGKFLFKVNGEPIMIRGTNHVPADAFHSRDGLFTPDILQSIADCGCNMVRCWGGNVYESDAFFDACDRLGLLVWQDMAFACSLYPIDGEFLNEVREEAKKVALRLRNHACLALYCGDNECDYGYNLFGIDPAKNRITRETLPDTLFLYDPHREYIPSSPYYTPEIIASGNVGLLPDDHLWGPRDYFKSAYYMNAAAHFVSEIGYHGCPDVSSLRKFLSPEKLFDMQSDEWIIHCSSPNGAEGQWAYRIPLMANQVKVMFKGEIDNIEDFALASQISQAEAMKFFIERVRMQKFEKSGIIWWNIRDGWPQFSDAVIDWYGNKKLAYHYIKQSQQPVAVMMNEPADWHVAVMVCNDTLSESKGRFEVLDENGNILESGDYACPANSAAKVTSMWAKPTGEKLFLLRILPDGGIAITNHYLLGCAPHELTQYRGYLRKIAEFTGAFDAEKIAK